MGRRRGPDLVAEGPGEGAGAHAGPGRQAGHGEVVGQVVRAASPAGRAAGGRGPAWARSWALNWAWPPGRRANTTSQRATSWATAEPWSASTRARARSIPAVTPAEVHRSRSWTWRRSGSTSTAGRGRPGGRTRPSGWWPGSRRAGRQRPAPAPRCRPRWCARPPRPSVPGRRRGAAASAAAGRDPAPPTTITVWTVPGSVGGIGQGHVRGDAHPAGAGDRRPTGRGHHAAGSPASPPRRVVAVDSDVGRPGQVEQLEALVGHQHDGPTLVHGAIVAPPPPGGKDNTMTIPATTGPPAAVPLGEPSDRARAALTTRMVSGAVGGGAAGRCGARRGGGCWYTRAMAERSTHRATVVSVRRETARISTFRLDLGAPLGHRAGQHVKVRVPAVGAKRSYSVASPPGRRRTIDITVERLEGGAVSGALHDRVQRGDVLEVRRPSGLVHLGLWHPGPAGRGRHRPGAAGVDAAPGPGDRPARAGAPGGLGPHRGRPPLPRRDGRSRRSSVVLHPRRGVPAPGARPPAGRGPAGRA